MFFVDTEIIKTDLLDLLALGGTKKQIVGQSELLPCVAARIVWEKRTRNRPTIHFVDNDAARFAMIKGSSPTPDSAWLTGRFWEEEARSGSFTWFERVASPSNPSDGPSRGVPPPAILTEEGMTIHAKEVPLPPGFEESIVQKWMPRILESRSRW